MAPDTSRQTEDPILGPLNEAQRRAVTHGEGPLLVIAGPGSGKTRVITHRIAYLVRQGVDPATILAITFTNKAAGEMRERVERLLGLSSPWISTFHSFAARLLRRHIYRLSPFDSSFSIYDADDSLALVKSCIKELDIATDILSPRQVLSEISRLKNRGVEDPEIVPPNADFHDRFVRMVYARYARSLEERNALDFDDLLLFLERLLQTQEDLLERYRAQFRHVLVDEYQDTNQVQYRIGQRIGSGHGNVCATGDPDQSIYSWRGADIRNILSFEKDFPSAAVVKLEQNYRSTRAILRVANAAIVHNQGRREKDLWTENPEGEPVRIYRFSSGEEEAAEIADLVLRLRSELGADTPIAVFYRINSLSREIEQALVVRGIPYSIVGGVEFYQRREIKDLIAYLRLLANPRDSESLRRIINVPPRRIGQKTTQNLFDEAVARGRSPLEVVLDPERGDGTRNRALHAFAALYHRLADSPGPGVAGLVRDLIEEIGYEGYLLRSAPEEAEERVANVRELVNAARQYDERNPEGTLGAFLEEVALLAAVDRWEGRRDRVSLMTLHAAKGLEFTTVVLAGCEEGILPLSRSGETAEDTEEERRLFYVGITRARENLYLTHAAYRLRYGQHQPAVPSSFLLDLFETHEGEGLELDDETRRALERLTEPFWDDRHHAGNARFGRGSFPDESSFRVDDWDDDILDEDPYPAGARVVHEIFGEGEVVRSSGLGRRRKLVVAFEDIGEKTLVLGHARIRRL